MWDRQNTFPFLNFLMKTFQASAFPKAFEKFWKLYLPLSLSFLKTKQNEKIKNLLYEV